MKLSDITDKTKLVKDFVAQLKKSTKQAIPIVDVEKVKRISGASARPVNMVLENGQSIKIYIRLAGDDDHLDIFRIDINGKSQPLSGDYDNSYAPSFNASVGALGRSITQNQAAFDKKRAKQKVATPSAKSGRTPMNKSQQRNAAIAESKELDAVIAQREQTKSELEAQLATLTA